LNPYVLLSLLNCVFIFGQAQEGLEEDVSATVQETADDAITSKLCVQGL
jgi:hypothetical protein